MGKIDKSRKHFLHQQFLDIIKQEIKKGLYKPLELIPSERNLVGKYDISRSTVRRAISQLISEGWLYSVPGTGTFVSKDLPMEKRQRSKSVACILKVAQSPLDSPYYSKIFKSMQEEAARIGYHLSFYSFVHDSEADILKEIRKRNLDGVVIIGFMGRKVISDVYNSKIPFILIDNRLNKEGVTSIVPGNRNGAFEATRYLVGLGHKTIFFMGGTKKDHAVMERFSGYLAALKEAGLDYRDEYYIKSHYRVGDGFNSMSKVLQSKNVPSAILCVNDESAIGALKAIQEAELKVPDDISIVGFDDIDWAAHTNPPLTTVKVQKEKMGRMAIDFLIRQIENKEFLGAEVVVPTELIIRSSCAKPSSPRSQ